jgi:hypothetical protein
LGFNALSFSILNQPANFINFIISIENMASPEFEIKSKDFLAWFKDLPGATFHDGLEIVDLRLRNAGRGIGMIRPLRITSTR